MEDFATEHIDFEGRRLTITGPPETVMLAARTLRARTGVLERLKRIGGWWFESPASVSREGNWLTQQVSEAIALLEEHQRKPT